MLNFSISWKHLKKSVNDGCIGSLYVNSDTENKNEEKDILMECSGDNRSIARVLPVKYYVPF